MKNCVKIQYLFFLTGLCFVLSFACHAHCADFPGYGFITEDQVNVRLDSTTGSLVLGTLNIDEPVRITGEKYSWYKITLPGRFHCFAASEYIQQTQGKKGTVTATSLNIRQSSSLESPILGKIPGERTVTIFRRQKEWTEISCAPYASGWVHKKFVKIDPEAQKLVLDPEPDIEPDETATPVQVQTPESVFPAQTEEKQKTVSASQPEVTAQPVAPRISKSEPKIVFTHPDTPPLANGILKKNRSSGANCPANYVLENNTGFIFLKITIPKFDPRILENKPVTLWGKIKTGACVYVDVTHIIPD